MKFNSFNLNTEYTQLMGKKAHRSFDKAFSKTYSKNDRIWVRDVLEIFAEKIEVPFALAVQAFKTGNIAGIQQHHSRMWIKAMEKTHTGLNRDAISEAEMRHRDFSQMDQVQFAAFVREQWSFALNVRHPSDQASLVMISDADKTEKAAAKFVAKAA